MDRADLIRLRKARDRMDRDYVQPLDVPQLARDAAMSVGHFQRQFRMAFGETPYNYLITRRIERAQSMLRSGRLSVTEVCLAVGFTSLGSFSKRFRELAGETPSAYRDRPHDHLRGIPGCVVMRIERPGPRPAQQRRVSKIDQDRRSERPAVVRRLEPWPRIDNTKA